jgi:mono/diheme cytochrome c family protein
VDNQLAQSPALTQRLILIAVAIAIIIFVAILSVHFQQMSDPYIQEVLAIKGDTERGNAMFQINCAGCHGLKADGNVGPSLQYVSKRKSKISLIQQVISGKTPPMPKFQPNPQEMADLLSYLEQL